MSHFSNIAVYNWFLTQLNGVEGVVTVKFEKASEMSIPFIRQALFVEKENLLEVLTKTKKWQTLESDKDLGSQAIYNYLFGKILYIQIPFSELLLEKPNGMNSGMKKYTKKNQKSQYLKKNSKRRLLSNHHLFRVFL